MKRMLDLFCGRLGWSKAFLARGWECIGVDLVEPPERPQNFFFRKMDILDLVDVRAYCEPDFICASSPCEQFSVHCMKFLKKKDHPYPDLGIQLFNHTRLLCEVSGLPYVMENVRCAQQFVGTAVGHAGSFFLWGNAVPPILPKGLIKMGNQGGWWKSDGSFRERAPGSRKPPARTAAIPPELANCVADYAERLLEQKAFGDSLPEQVDGRQVPEQVSLGRGDTEEKR
jgi:hypothetical protein